MGSGTCQGGGQQKGAVPVNVGTVYCLIYLFLFALPMFGLAIFFFEAGAGTYDQGVKDECYENCTGNITNALCLKNCSAWEAWENFKEFASFSGVVTILTFVGLVSCGVGLAVAMFTKVCNRGGTQTQDTAGYPMRQLQQGYPGNQQYQWNNYAQPTPPPAYGAAYGAPLPAYGTVAGHPYGTAAAQPYGTVPGQPYGTGAVQPYGTVAAQPAQPAPAAI